MGSAKLSGRVGARFFVEVLDDPEVIASLRAGAGLGWNVLSETECSTLATDPEQRRWLFWIQSADAPVEAEGIKIAPTIGKRDGGPREGGSHFVSSWGIPPNPR